MTKEKRALVACGTSIATGTVAAVKVKEIAQEAGIPLKVSQCKIVEVPGKIETFQPHFIVTTGTMPDNLEVPVFKGLPFLTGIGLDQLKEQILEILRADD